VVKPSTKQKGVVPDWWLLVVDELSELAMVPGRNLDRQTLPVYPELLAAVWGQTWTWSIL
jgi:hypothetical protein